jgi:hypothetical protein
MGLVLLPKGCRLLPDDATVTAVVWGGSSTRCVGWFLNPKRVLQATAAHVVLRRSKETHQPP